MHYYYAYGLTIASAFPLPELQPADRHESPAVVIKRGDLEPVPSPGETTQPRRFEAKPGVCRLTYENLGTFRIEDGCRILADVQADVEMTKVFRRMLEGQVFGIVLHQRGLLVLHASAVATDGEVTVFLGPVGAGKSTTAAACHAKGHWLLDDDIVAIEVEDERSTPRVRPGVPELKLYPAVAETLGVEAPVADYDDEKGETGKQYHQTGARWHPESLPLAQCYLLAERETVAVTPLSTQEQFRALLSNTYNAGLLADTDTSSVHLTQCARVAETTTLAELGRPMDLELLPDVIDDIVDGDRVETGTTDD